MLYRVKKKTSLLNLKIKPEVHQEFRIAAELKGSTMSSLLHQFIVQTIWDEKKKHPDVFAQLVEQEEKPPTVTKSTPKPRPSAGSAIRNAFLDGNPSKKGKAKSRKVSKATEKAVRERLETYKDDEDSPDE